MNTVLIGFKSVGKSTLAKLLSKKVNSDYIDSDDVIIKLDKRNKTCRDIFIDLGDKKFRNLEKKAIQSLKKQENSIISLGGGAVDRNQQLIKSLGNIIFLSDEKDIIFKRIKKKGFPPFYDKMDPKKTFDDLFNKRNKIYLDIADYVINCNNFTKKQIIEQIWKVIK